MESVNLPKLDRVKLRAWTLGVRRYAPECPKIVPGSPRPPKLSYQAYQMTGVRSKHAKEIWWQQRRKPSILIIILLLFIIIIIIIIIINIKIKQ